MREHDFEPVPGLPGRLPPGETLLWQGSPNWNGLAKRALHVRAIAGYFALLVIWREWSLLAGDAGWQEAVAGGLMLAALGVAAVGILLGLAWVAARGTVYSITNRRVVMRFGIAFPGAINLPFKSIESAGMWTHSDGTGDIALALAKGNHVGWVLLWPHVRARRFSHPQPMLRAVAEPHEVARILNEALAAAPQPVAVRVQVPTEPVEATSPLVPDRAVA